MVNETIYNISKHNSWRSVNMWMHLLEMCAQFTIMYPVQKSGKIFSKQNKSIFTRPFRNFFFNLQIAPIEQKHLDIIRNFDRSLQTLVWIYFDFFFTHTTATSYNWSTSVRNEYVHMRSTWDHKRVQSSKTSYHRRPP